MTNQLSHLCLLYKSYNRIIRHELLMYTQYQHFWNEHNMYGAICRIEFDYNSLQIGKFSFP